MNKILKNKPKTLKLTLCILKARYNIVINTMLPISDDLWPIMYTRNLKKKGRPVQGVSQLRLNSFQSFVVTMKV
jgi:hypothetical protein